MIELEGACLENSCYLARIGFIRRLASILLALCFVLPLSQCDVLKEVDGVTVRQTSTLAGYDLISPVFKDLDASNASDSAMLTLAVLLVFFLPVATWKLPDPWQAVIHLVASPMAGFCVYMWVFTFGSRPLFGGLVTAACWTILLLASAVILLRRHAAARPAARPDPGG